MNIVMKKLKLFKLLLLPLSTLLSGCIFSAHPAVGVAVEDHVISPEKLHPDGAEALSSMHRAMSTCNTAYNIAVSDYNSALKRANRFDCATSLIGIFGGAYSGAVSVLESSDIGTGDSLSTSSTIILGFSGLAVGATVALRGVSNVDEELNASREEAGKLQALTIQARQLEARIRPDLLDSGDIDDIERVTVIGLVNTMTLALSHGCIVPIDAKPPEQK